MEKKQLFGLLSVISFLSILFTPSGSETWKLLFVAGVVFGLVWWFGK